MIRCATKNMIALSLCLGCIPSMILAASPQLDAIVPEAVVRRLARRKVMPVYPQTSQQRGSNGIAVASLKIDDKGNLIDVTILEAPDPDIEHAVIDAIRKWRFSSATANKKPTRIQGKLTFYFTLNHGKGVVNNPRKFDDSQR